MADTAARNEPQIYIGGGGGGVRERDFGDYGGGGLPPGTTRRVYRTGMWMALVAISMLFVAFTSAYVVRSGLGDDWQPLALPPLVWWNTLALLLSSYTMEQTRRTLTQGQRVACNRWILATAVLGTLFVAGQLLVWRELVSRGIYVVTNPSSSFFYLLTGAHGLHVLGGLIALFYVALEAWRYRLGPAKRTLVEVTALYWHFMDGLWVYLLLLLWLWR